MTPEADPRTATWKSAITLVAAAIPMVVGFMILLSIVASPSHLALASVFIASWISNPANLYWKAPVASLGFGLLAFGIVWFSIRANQFVKTHFRIKERV